MVEAVLFNPEYLIFPDKTQEEKPKCFSSCVLHETLIANFSRK
jgi:hypothetical protein